MHIKKGLDVPINGKPQQKVSDKILAKNVAILGSDYVGMKPSMLVKEGDSVKAGQVVFTCKKVEGVRYCSPASGKVTAINRGEKRIFQSLVIEAEDANDQIDFEKHLKKEAKEYSFEDTRDLLNEAGMWNSLRTRPYSKAPELDSKPNSLFITLTDTNPLAANPALVISEYSEFFKAGVELFSNLSEKTYLCKNSKTKVPSFDASNIEEKDFDGVHPAGNVGTHIHFIDPVDSKKTVWHVGYQDVIAAGSLVVRGKLLNEKIISIAGPGVSNPRLIRTNIGASIAEVLSGQLKQGENRIISGPVLNGSEAKGPYAYLGKFDNQISVIKEGREREFMGWQSPGLDKFSIKNIYLSKLLPSKLFSFSTTTHGSVRAMVPMGMYEKVMPMDILPTQLLRSLLTKDTDQAQRLGCLELDEEDLALCTFACPGKIDYGPALRESLTTIEKEG